MPAAHAAEEYASLFAAAGIDSVSDEPTSIARQISTSDIKHSLIAALDDGAVCESDEAQGNWILKVAQGATGRVGRPVCIVTARAPPGVLRVRSIACAPISKTSDYVQRM